MAACSNLTFPLCKAGGSQAADCGCWFDLRMLRQADGADSWQEKAAVLLGCLSSEVVEQPSASRAEESCLSAEVPSLRQGFRGLRQQPQEILLSCVLYRRAVWRRQERQNSEVIARDEGTVSARENVPSHDGDGAPYAFHRDYLLGGICQGRANLPRKI